MSGEGSESRRPLPTDADECPLDTFTVSRVSDAGCRSWEVSEYLGTAIETLRKRLLEAETEQCIRLEGPGIKIVISVGNEVSIRFRIDTDHLMDSSDEDQLREAIAAMVIEL